MSSSHSKAYPRKPAKKEQSHGKVQINMDDKRMSNFTAINDMYSCMVKVMSNLSVSDRLRAANVNKFFRMVATHPTLWTTVSFEKVFVNDWEIAFAFLKSKGTKCVDLRHMLLPRPSELSYMWEDFVASIANLPSLEEIHMCPCDDTVVSSILKMFPHLKVFEAYEISTKTLSCEALASSTKMKELVLNGLSILNDQQHFKSLAIEGNLTALTLTGIENISDDIMETIERCVNLEILDLGKCDQITGNTLANALSGLNKLIKVRLEELGGNNYAYLYELGKLPDLKCLELINVKVKMGFKMAIRECQNISLFLIIPNYIEKAANTNTMVMETITVMNRTLRWVGWGFTLELIRATDLYMMHNQTSADGTVKYLPAQHGKCVPVTPMQKGKGPAKNPNNMAVLYLNEIELLLRKTAPNTSINLFSCTHKNTCHQYVPQNMYRKVKK